MTNQLAETKQEEKGLQVKDQADKLQVEARHIAQRLKYMIQNGNKLADAEVYALAQYAAANQLNPFAGECYYIPGVGPTPGIAGWRTKATLQLWHEADVAKVSSANFWTTDRPATIADCLFDPSKDVAFVVTLRDSISTARWRVAIFEAADQFKKFGAEDPIAEAKAMVGPEPSWEGIGIVFSSESFTKSGGTEKFAREERAKKRAEKIAIRKRFPMIHLPEPTGFDNESFDEADYKMVMDEPERTKEDTAKLVDSMFPPDPYNKPDLPESYQPPVPRVTEVEYNDFVVECGFTPLEGQAILAQAGGDYADAKYRVNKKYKESLEPKS